MAAVDLFGRTLRVTAAGSTPSVYSTLRVKSLAIWSLDTTASLIAVEVGTAGEILRFSNATQLTNTQVLPWVGTFGQLSFNTVTACTAYLTLE